MRPVRPLAAVIAPLAALLLFAATESAAQASYSRTSAPAQAVGSASVVLKPNQLDFNFGAGKATLTPKGEWTVEASVSHRGLLCGEYSVGIRFGIGRPGCSNVAWLTDVSYATTQRQCNNATLYHQGGDVQPELAASFAPSA
jgi:hypothetical protein